MRMHQLVIGISIVAALPTLASAGGGTVISLTPVKDATLYEFATGQLANGAGQHLFAGKTAQSEAVNERRMVIEFDLSSIPSGSTIFGIEFQVTVDRANNSGPVDFTVHKMLTEWGEGTSDAPGQEGAGTVATPGSATWIHSFSPGDLWATPGGDFEVAPSAGVTINEEGQWFFSSAGLVADVQGWFDDPTTNHGWLFLGPDVAPGIATAKRFTSREGAIVANRPTLFIGFNEPTVCLGDCDQSGTVDFNDLVSMLFLFGTDPGDGCDADESANVDFNDLVATLFLFGPCP